MKRIPYLTSVLSTSLLIMTAACSPQEKATKTLEVQVKVVLPQEFSSDAVYAEHEVTLGKYTAVTDASGIATFKDVIPDVYDISTSCEITAEEYREMTGKESQNENYVISGSMLNQTVATEAMITLQTNASVKQSLVVSKIYYSGTKDKNSKNYLAGKYVEFFNNSNQTIDIAGLYFGLIESESSPAYPTGTTPDYLYLKQIYRFPTTTGSINVEPGKSIIVANSAIDHSANNEVDLSGADYEAKFSGTGGFTNNPDVPAIDVIYSYITNTSMNLVQGGPCSIVLFKTDENTENWERVYKQGASKGNLYVKMPITAVMDGVECMKNKTTGVDVTTKRLYDYIDSGYQKTESTSGYTAEVIYRKISTTEDGRIVLADTNNSSNDFAVAKDIKPREYR